jgi:hypothetical protein
MKSRGKLGYYSNQLLHELFQTFLCSANLRKDGRGWGTCGKPGEVGERDLIFRRSGMQR